MIRTRTQFLWCPAAHVDGLGEQQDKHPAVCLPTAYPDPPFPSLRRPCSECHYTPFLCATKRGPAKPQGVHCTLKTCCHMHLSTIPPSHPHLLSALLPSGSSAVGGSITFWRSSTPAPLGAHNIVPGLGSCYSSAYHRLQHVPGKPSYSLSLSFHLSVSFTNTLSSSFLSYSVANVLRRCLFSHNLSHIHRHGLIHHCHDLCVWYLQNVRAMQRLAHMSKNKRHVLSKLAHSQKQDTDHMIIETIVMMISLRMLKKSHMTFPRSPILPMQIPNVMKKPIKPGGKHETTRVNHHSSR